MTDQWKPRPPVDGPYTWTDADRASPLSHYSVNADTAGAAYIDCDRDGWYYDDQLTLDGILRAVEAHEREAHS